MTSNAKTTKVNLRLIAATSLLAMLTACGGGGGGGSSGSSGSSNNSDGSLTANGVTVGFDVTDAVSLMTAAKALDSTTTLSGLVTGSGPLLTEATTWTPRSTSVLAGLIPLAGAATGSSNLISVNSTGTAKLAMSSSMPIKVLYSAIDPSGTYAYFALDSDNQTQSNLNFSQTIATLNCGLFQVKRADNSTKCVGEGKLLRAIDDSYRQALSADSKPIQFDKNGNVYFAATTFTSNCWQNGSVKQCSMNGYNWNDKQVYKYSLSTGNLTVVSQDNEVTEYFAVLPAGDVVFNTHQTTGSWRSKLSMLRTNGTNVVLADNMDWGTTFTTDTNDAVIWANQNYSSTENGIRFARPNPSGQSGGNWAMLNTNLFANNNGNIGYTTPTPRRLIVADDGKLYGVFESYRSICNNGGACTSENSLRVNQVLPYDPVPKVVLRMPTNNWWDWMRTTPFVVSKGFLYYKETVDPGDGNGSRDVINMVRLSDRTQTTILSNEVFQIYNWQLAGDVLYFSGLKNSVNKVVMGQIDALKVNRGRPASEYLSLKYTASAASAASTINDIEVVRPVIPVDPTSAPVLESFSADQENIYSVSLAFTKGMNMKEVTDNITMKKTDQTAVTFFPVWIYKSLHLIPVGAGLTYSTRANDTPLAYNTGYVVNLPANRATDLAGIYLSSAVNKNFTTRPADGWYMSTASLDNTGLSLDSDNNIAKWAQGRDANGLIYTANDYTVATNMPENFRIEFSARNNNWSGLSMYLWFLDSNVSQNRRLLQMDLGNWTGIYAREAGSGWRNINKNQQTSNAFTGEWLKYRVDVWGAKVRLSYCKEACSNAGNWVAFPSALEIDNLETRSIGSMSLNITLTQSLDLGSIKIVSLDPLAATATIDTGVSATLSEEFGGNAVPLWLQAPLAQNQVPPWN